MFLWCHITDGVRLRIWPSLWRATFRPTVPSHKLNTHAHTLHYNSQWDVCLPLPRFILKESGLARYLHSAVLISGVLLVFGGNTHNDTSLSNGAKCFSSDFLSYDIGMNHLWPPFSDYTSTSLKVKCRIIIIVILHKFPVVIFVKIIIVALFGNFCTSHFMKLYDIHNYHTLN